MIAMTLTGKVPTLKLADNSFSKSIQKSENASCQSQSGGWSRAVLLGW
jgi:hypothetical protein